jgi:hypothetical protein
MKKHWRSNILFYSTIIVYMVITYWLLWPYAPITIHNINILNENNIAYAGEKLKYETVYTKTKSYPVVKVTRQIIDGAVIVLPKSKNASRLPIGDNKVLVEVLIPEFACAKDYRFHLTAEYQVNPIRTVTVFARSKPFTVKKKEKEDKK